MPRISMTVNGEAQAAEADTRTLLVEFLREQLGLTGTHVGCDTTQCGACMVILNGDMVKSCTVFAVQAEGAELRTIEGVADGETLHPVQEAFHVHHGLQCGFCTPGMVMTALALLEANPRPGEAEVRAWFNGNLCRCTGYHNIVKAVLAAAEEMAR